MEFDRFNLPYFSGRITLLPPSSEYGKRLLHSVELDGPSALIVHAFGKNRFKPLAASLFAL